MKLYYIANSRIPTEKAHGIQIMKMCEAFAEADADIELVVPKRKNPDFKNMDPFDYYGAKKNFVINYLDSYDPVWLMRFPRGWYIKVQASLFMLKLHSYLQEVDFTDEDILYTRDEYLLSVLQKFSGRVVWETHNLPSKSEYYLKYWKKCHSIIAITQGLKNELASLGIDENKILVAPDAVDLDLFDIPYTKYEIRQQLNLPQDKFIVAYTGHLYDWKGASVLLEAAKNTKYQIPNTIYIFVGGTDSDIQKFRAEAKGMDNILILGHKPHSEIPKYLAAADVLVLPTSGKSKIGKKYTSPMKLFEYMASGKPIVASDLLSIREILDEDSVVFFEADNSESLKNAILELLQDSELSAKISRSAWEKARRFTWENRAQNILKFIQL